MTTRISWPWAPDTTWEYAEDTTARKLITFLGDDAECFVRFSIDSYVWCPWFGSLWRTFTTDADLVAGVQRIVSSGTLESRLNEFLVNGTP